MTTTDEWGRDPSVMAMRSLFARMESEQRTLLQRLGIPPYDSRLRACREDARDRFETVFSGSAQGRPRDEKDAVSLYIRALIQALKERGLPVPAEALRENPRIRDMTRRR
jgi:hypothetical protein